MEIEKKSVKLLIDGINVINEDLTLYEESPDDGDMVLLEIVINGQKISCKSDNFFLALRYLRKELENKNIQIMCNGCAKNVHPSPMQLSMGSGRMAYKLYIGQQARKTDIVDIFDCDEGVSFVGIDEQSEFYDKWVKSIIK
ncbi:MAG: hypothetical protein MJA82_21790 [Clostridia bacterium]|nr:hypothetical protein [Clostridia bacterium]